MAPEIAKTCCLYDLSRFALLEQAQNGPQTLGKVRNKKETFFKESFQTHLLPSSSQVHPKFLGVHKWHPVHILKFQDALISTE